MSQSVKDLTKEFRPKAEALIKACEQRGIEMRPYFTLRDPFEQGRLWRQSRSREEIRVQVRNFRDGGADFLADCIESVGPQHGPEVTKTPPGYSWHQWGEALDCMWVVNGKAEWSTQKLVGGLNGYRVYADEAEKLGLTAGGHWKNFKDWPHTQLRKASNAGSVFTLTEIDGAMRKRFGK